MTDGTPLEQQKCKPCEGIGQAMSAANASGRLKDIPGWKLDGNGKKISRTFVTKNFLAAVDFIGKVARTAEAEDHHPDVHLTGYRNLTIDLSTHAIGGLSDNDFILAAKINQLPVELKNE